MSFKIVIPLTDREPSQTFRNDLRTVTPRMVQQFGNFFRAAASGTNVPVSILYTMAMIESTGNHTRNGAVIVTGRERSTGIMQISPASFYETLKFEIRRNRLTPESQAVLRRFLPNFRFTMGRSIPPTPSQATLDMIAVALRNVEFNIWASAMVLRRLLEDTATADKVMRLDKAIVKYNVGEYSRPTRTEQFATGDTTALLTVVPRITNEYIIKAVGKNGGLEYMIRNNIR